MIFSRHCGVTPSPDIRSPYTNSGILDPATGCRSFHISSISWHYGGFNTKVVFWMILGYPHFRKTPIIYFYMNIELYIYIYNIVCIYIYIYTCICSSGTSYHLHPKNFSRISIQIGWSPPRWWEMWPSSPCRRRTREELMYTLWLCQNSYGKWP